MKCRFRLLLLLGFVATMMGCDTLSKYPIDARPMVDVDTNLIGIWQMREDTISHDFYVVQRYDTKQYTVCYMNQGGTNRRYENYGAYFSTIGNARFLNVFYRDYNFDTKESIEGFLLFKMTYVDPRGFNIEMAMVSDTTLKYLSSPEQVRAKVGQNLNNPTYFEKPVHFHKSLPLMYCK